MELRELQTFQTIVATRNFSKAATLLGYTQSTVSMQMRHLEADLGQKLLTYQNRQVQLTPAGRQLLPLVDRVLNDTAAITQWQQQEVGSLRVAAPESLTLSLIAPALRAFSRAFPQVQLRLQNATCLHNEEQLLRGNVDVAFMLWPSQPNRQLIDADLGRQAMTLVTAAPAPTFAQLLTDSRATFIINEPECSYRRQFETAVWQQHQRQFPTMELPSIAAIKASVSYGLGFSYLPTTMVAPELATGQLVAVPTDIDNHIHAHGLIPRVGKASRWSQELIRLTQEMAGKM